VDQCHFGYITKLTKETPVGSFAKNKIRMFFKKYFHILACNKIWLNLPMNHHHFGYTTKLTKETLVGSFARKKEGCFF
jgi:hypothetical protein